MGINMDTLQGWTDRYVEAWRSNDPQAIGELFTDEAHYFTHPFREQWRGREEIVRGWAEHPDDPGSWSCDYRALAVQGQTGVIRGNTSYFGKDGSVETAYANVFVAQFDDSGRCSEFTEFFMRSDPPARA